MSSSKREIIIDNSKTRSIGWAEGRPELYEWSYDQKIVVRIQENGGEGIVVALGEDALSVKEATNEAMEIAKKTPKDIHRRLVERGQAYADPIPVDDQLFQQSHEELSTRLHELENKILNVDRKIKKVVKLRFSEDIGERQITTSEGLDVSKRVSATSVMAEILAEEGPSTEVAWDSVQARFGHQLDLDQMAISLADNAVKSLGGQPISSQLYSVVLHPRVGVQILSLLAGALSAESVQRRKSFLKGLLGKKVSSPQITMIDDPFRPDGLASAPFDDEGSVHQRLAVVEKGILKDYFYDLRTASKDGRTSNGHGGRPVLGSAPTPRPTNFYIEAGPHTGEALLASEEKVFLVREVMGLHMADPISGEFSLGASGYLYEKGVFSKPVRGVTIAGQLNSLLNNVEAVGNDLTWYGAYGAPSILIPRMSVAGN